ncbi:membrane protein insertion efficiency factor YidD [soil metagenome]
MSNIRSPLALLMEGLIRLYRLVPKMGEHCRFHPSCSAYGLEAVQVHGAIRGGWLITKRLARCQPWGGTGLDPVPPRRRRPSPHDGTTTPMAPVGAPRA